MIEPSTLLRAFKEKYGAEPRLFRAPGRVNLIGEHTDYNEGLVLPVAIELGTLVAAAARPDRAVRVCSLNMDEEFEFDLDRLGSSQAGAWPSYVKGVAQALKQRGTPLTGADLMVESDVPIGAGLSSSAALEISVALALASLAGSALDKVALALAGQAAEHDYVGIKCGIMDQYVAALAKAGCALLIDCRSLQFTPIPIDFSRYAIVICDTGVKHRLASAAYNARRAECERGVKLLSRMIAGIRSLRDVSREHLDYCQDRLPEPIRRRCRHVVTENERTAEAAAALRAGDFQELGRLMRLSHESLRMDYEVSCPELDLMVEIAASCEGVAGARMTGAGFGGCTVNFVARNGLEDFRQRVSREYNRATKITPAFYVSEAGDGASEIACAVGL